MDTAILVTRTDLGVVNGCQVWQVRNADTGEVIGTDMASLDDIA